MWLALLTLITLAGAGGRASAQIQQAKLLPAGLTNSSLYGDEVVLIPGWAICGASNDLSVQPSSGAVFVFQGSGAAWTLVQKLKAPVPSADARFGIGVAADGDWMVVTASSDDPPGYTDKGAAYVYHLQGGAWVHTQTIVASDIASPTQFYFGSSAALQGSRMFIGAASDDEQALGAGAVYAFELSGSTWTEIAKLHASDAGTDDNFGNAVDVDGDTLVVGAYEFGFGVPHFNQGAAYVFERRGGTWLETKRLVSDHATHGDRLGWSVAVDGDTIVVGSQHTHAVSKDGAAFVFERQGGAWGLTQELRISDPADGPRFGMKVDVEGDLAIGGAVEDDDVGPHCGSAYVFKRMSSGTWLQIAKVLAADAAGDRLFGSDVALRGSQTLVGSSNDSSHMPFGGSAYVFELAPAAIQYGSCPNQGPCGNHDDFGGCSNSSGHGGVLSAAGSASVGADDLRFEARWLPADKNGIFFMGGLATASPFADGQLCVTSGALGLWRLTTPQSTGPNGVLSLGPGVVGVSHSLPLGGHITAGQTWHFQAWFRDPAGPCAKGSNVTNAVRVMFAP